MFSCPTTFSFFFFNDTATTEIYTLSLHDALPIYARGTKSGKRREVPMRQAVYNVLASLPEPHQGPVWKRGDVRTSFEQDRKSTRLNSSHLVISYAVFCLKKKKKISILSTRMIRKH